MFRIYFLFYDPFSFISEVINLGFSHPLSCPSRHTTSSRIHICAWQYTVFVPSRNSNQ